MTRSLFAAALATSFWGCGGGGRAGGGAGTTQDAALSVVRDNDANISVRLAAIRRAWTDVEEGRADRHQTREAFKSLVWRPSTINCPGTVRGAAIEMLLRDTTEDGIADTRNLFRLRIPTETDWTVLERLCDGAAERGWVELTPAIIRSFARPVKQPTDDERPERSALERLHPGTPVVEVVYRVFVAPPADAAPARGAAAAAGGGERIRRDAWEILTRLDGDGSRRRQLLARGDVDARSDPTLAALRAGARDLRVVPLTGSELEWLEGLHKPSDPVAAAWWREAAEAVAKLGDAQTEAFALRHVEPVRWATRYHPEWVSLDRDALLSELRGRLSGRKVYEREAESESFLSYRSQTLRDAEESLVWGDLLAVLVIDEALKDRGVVRALFEQTEIDRADASTEHGGSLEAAQGSGGGAAFRAVHYPPRPSQRLNDTTFVASDDMFRESVRGLAHYHFHVQTPRNQLYAGPGSGDLEYADKHGRNCLVFTSIDERTLNVDYYQRAGGRGKGGRAVLDLGTIQR